MHSTARAHAVRRLPDSPEAGVDWTIHVYAHTHWDREWYLPFERYRTKLVGAVDEILDTLQHRDDFTCYVLDGQTIVLDDYLALRPDRVTELQQLIGEGRLEIGPWYILPDEFLVSGESLIRNLLEGRRGARRFGEPTPVGYLPDPFGHVAQLPQLLAGFGIPVVIFSRGMDDRIEETGSHFEWVAPDGSSSVLAVVQMGHELENGYCNASPLSAVRGVDQAEAIDWCDHLTDHLAPDARVPAMLFAAGADHYSINAALPELVQELDSRYSNARVQLGSLAAFGEDVIAGAERAARAGMPLQRSTGELRGSRHAPILSSIFSARIPLKQDNVRVQTALERYVEPLCAIAESAGMHRTQPGTLRHAWRLALQNQPHDSIGGCSVDATHDDMPPRTKRALEVCDDLIREVLIALGVSTQTLVFNPHPCAAGGIVNVQGDLRWVAPTPPLQLSAVPDVACDEVSVGDDGAIDNAVLRVGVSNGAVWLEHRPSGLRYENVLEFIDEADAGDEYDFGMVAGDTPIVARLVAHDAEVLPGGIAQLTLRHTLSLPTSLADDRLSRSSECIEHTLVTKLRLAGDLPWVECHTAWNNQSTDHRLRVRIALGSPADATISDGHFAIIERPATLPVPVTEWRQDPTPVRHCESMAAICDNAGERGIAVLTRGLHEFALGGTDEAATLDVTVVRSVGWLSRNDIAGRPAHAGPGLATPGGQCLGHQSVEYAIAPFAGDWESARVPEWATRFVAPPLVLEPLDDITRRSDAWRYRALDIESRAAGGHHLHIQGSPANRYAGTAHPPGAADFHQRLATFNSAAPEVSGGVLTALKSADDGSGDMIIRTYNPYRSRCASTVVSASEHDPIRVRLDEEPLGDSASGHGMSTALEPAAIRTVRIPLNSPTRAAK